MIPVDCIVCMGQGFVQVRKGIYDYKYHCTCRHGEAHKYDGEECVKQKSRYFVPSVDSLPSGEIERIKADNIKRYDLRKAGDRWLKELSERLTDAQVSELNADMRRMFGL